MKITEVDKEYLKNKIEKCLKYVDFMCSNIVLLKNRHEPSIQTIESCAWRQEIILKQLLKWITKHE